MNAILSQNGDNVIDAQNETVNGIVIVDVRSII